MSKRMIPPSRHPRKAAPASPTVICVARFARVVPYKIVWGIPARVALRPE
ncbi:MAG TPA: hypothetical protein VNE71_17250 [Myxococcota bacterium]|nr:hypothetical protein [Myxococcota bacterium]